MKRELLSGDCRAFLAFLGTGLVVLGFLFVTVHNRRPSRDAAQHVEWNQLRRYAIAHPVPPEIRWFAIR